MDSGQLILAIVVVVLIVLLLRCRNDDKKVGTAVTAVVAAAATKGSGTGGGEAAPAEPTGPPKSDWGTGVDNRQFNARYKELSNVDKVDDYNEIVQHMALEPEVYESHRRYTSDIGRTTSGASMLPVRDDPNDTVPWIGLRKPRYRDVYTGPNARQETSEYPDQQRANSFYCVG
jgi:hypothetical protein